MLIAGNLRKTSKLLSTGAMAGKRCGLRSSAMQLDARNRRCAGSAGVGARGRGSNLAPTISVAGGLMALSGGERGLLVGEIEKLALYLRLARGAQGGHGSTRSIAGGGGRRAASVQGGGDCSLRQSAWHRA